MDNVQLFNGDCLEVMKGMESNSVDTVITDPPYGLGFMGKEWDHGLPGVPFWKEILRVAKPGAILLAFGGTRTFHRLVCAIEDAGWEIRDEIAYLYDGIKIDHPLLHIQGQGFPKSLNIGKAMDQKAGAKREVVGKYQPPNGQEWNLKQASGESDDHVGGTFTASGTRTLDITGPVTDMAKEWEGYGSALKPAHEPICVAMKPIEGSFVDNALKYGVAGLNIDGARIGTGEETIPGGGNGLASHGGKFGSGETCGTRPKVMSHNKGRWPSNVIHDGSESVVSGFPSTVKQAKCKTDDKSGWQEKYVGGDVKAPVERKLYLDKDNGGNASRFFYVAKASRKEREAGCEGLDIKLFAQSGGAQSALAKGDVEYQEGDEVSTGLNTVKRVRNNHPTVKPIALMTYLCNLTKTPKGGIVLDPFMGSGTTGIACVQTGRKFIGIEKEAEYFKIAEHRIAHYEPEEDESEPVQTDLFEERT